MFADPSGISLNNVQGCTQLIGNKVNAGQDVRLTNCGFVAAPEPNTGLLVALGLVGMLLGLPRPGSVARRGARNRGRYTGSETQTPPGSA